MRFGWLTLGLALAGATLGAAWAGVTWQDTCTGDSLDILCFSRGDVMMMGGFGGALLGTGLGLVVWVAYAVTSWIGRRYDDV
jgi:hypothetical protein